MPAPGVLQVSPRLAIPLAEFRVQATRAGGPGGQHVNTSATRVELWWDVTRSPSLSPAVRSRLLERLGPRLDASGRLRVVASEHRSQTRNREAALDRVRALVAVALRPRRARIPTTPPAAATARRLEAKRHRADRKRERRRSDDE